MNIFFTVSLPSKQSSFRVSTTKAPSELNIQKEASDTPGSAEKLNSFSLSLSSLVVYTQEGDSRKSAADKTLSGSPKEKESAEIDSESSRSLQRFSLYSFFSFFLLLLKNHKTNL